MAIIVVADAEGWYRGEGHEQRLAAEAALHAQREGGLLVTCDSVQHWVPHRLMSTVTKIVTALLGFVHPAQIGPRGAR